MKEKENNHAQSEDNSNNNNKNDTFTYQQLNFNEDPKFRAMSDFFNITLPEHNLWEEKEVPGTYKGITEGYFLLLNPLPPGNHTLYYEVCY